ncbi:telomere stability and silencing-domain-containing protein [Tricharina praecox]|uniref:telomere stability and silencing-domain-containing protein n=1 Tax=Tricharina praecox TaxID=43433 RepID=UPI002220F7C6|nr:telomere stability and silencing-domain-containing protein [Tricharina praecox]KAI5853822.1 telomere stability and silencing-domain-containing protein [Tricharina praecox]
MINTHITTFAGLPNLNLPLPPSTLISTVYSTLLTRLSLPPSHGLILSTTSGRLLAPSSSTPLSSLSSSDLLTLRLTHPLCGGKGGFGSQLRAAGGRMSSRKKSQENSDSCRNLDGRRMRTVKEAKALAAWLEVKPEMERREKEVRLKRWRDIVEAAERREENGDAAKGRFDDHEWIEALEEGKERTREAVLGALREAGLVKDAEEEGEEGGESSGESSGGEAEGSGSAVRRAVDMAKKEGKKEVVERKFAGWNDEDDEFMSSDEEMEDIAEEDEEGQEPVDVKGKGKVKA